MIVGNYDKEILSRIGQKTRSKYINTGLNPITVSKTLKRFEALNMITRKQYECVPPKVEYSITEKGEKALVLLTDYINTIYDKERRD